MSKHTPGPWKILHGGLTDSDEGFSISSKMSPGFGLVAECWHCTTTLESRRETNANARLIVAAPDLLAACKEVIRHIQPCDASSQFWETVHAAIAKAEGTAP